MDPVGNVNPVLEALRRQLAENVERLRRAGKIGGAPASHGERAVAPESLEPSLRRRLAGVDRRSPEGKRQATRVFVEAVLVAEFGEGLLSDPGLGEMLGEISASLREDTDIRERLDELLQQL